MLNHKPNFGIGGGNFTLPKSEKLLVTTYTGHIEASQDLTEDREEHIERMEKSERAAAAAEAEAVAAAAAAAAVPADVKFHVVCQKAVI